MNKENEEKKDNCKCGHHHGKHENCECHEEHNNCTCGDDCNCNEEHDCGCHGHHDSCTCGDDCECNEEHDCGCHGHHDNCTCGDDCDCNEEHDCGCHGHHDSCNCEAKGSEEYLKYEQAFIQLENALIKADTELQKARKEAEENERLAISIKKDFERYKARAAEEQLQKEQAAVEKVADKLIPILDNFQQALKVVSDENVQKGFKMIENLLKNAVLSLGIEEIEAEGKEFNPKLHNAVSRQKTSDKKKDNMVATVFTKGYKFAGESGKVIRHSTVEIYLQD